MSLVEVFEAFKLSEGLKLRSEGGWYNLHKETVRVTYKQRVKEESLKKRSFKASSVSQKNLPLK